VANWLPTDIRIAMYDWNGDGTPGYKVSDTSGLEWAFSGGMTLYGYTMLYLKLLGNNILHRFPGANVGNVLSAWSCLGFPAHRPFLIGESGDPALASRLSTGLDPSKGWPSFAATNLAWVPRYTHADPQV
jgi:hypothetical protein